MAALKAKMFEEVPLADGLRILGSRRLGSAQVRLLPKRDTMRPIMNLRRRTMPKGSKKVLGPSINSVLGPVSTMLKLERVSKLEALLANSPTVTEFPRRKAAFD